MDAGRLLEGLDDAQRAAVVSDARPLCILAGAGAGKTRVLTRRIGHRVLTGSADPAHVLALTFTRKAASELGRRLGRLGIPQLQGAPQRIEAGTFHAVAYGQLRQRWADRGERAPTLLERKARLLAPMLRSPGGGKSRLQAMDVASEIEWAKARMVTPDRYEAEVAAARRTPPAPAAEIAGYYERYEQLRKQRGLVDFDDLLLQCAQAMEDDKAFADAQRWKFAHLFVDEFQDVNPAQYRLLRNWLGDRDDLCVVGDANQAIYSWNGADPALLGNFTDAFPSAEVLRLDTNYRCTPQIVGVAAAVLPAGAQRHRSAAENGPLPKITAFSDERAEARGIASALRRAHPGRRWSEMAVLVRTNAQAVEIQRALTTAHIPCRVRGGGFLEQPEIKDALADLRARRVTDPLSTWTRDLEEMITEAPPDRQANLESLLTLAAEFSASGLRGTDASATTDGFVSWLAATTRDDHPDADADAVELCTFHRAKGLEWPLVVVAGMEEGLVPIARSVEIPAALAEEHRLVYVALTRSSHTLHCTWAEQRTFGTRSMRRSRSLLLASIEAATAALDGTGDPDWRLHLDNSRGQLASAKSRSSRPKAEPRPDDPLVADLRAWRLATARAANVPAYVVFHDTTLVAIAEVRPLTLDDLRTVPGLGPVKATRFGEAVLELVAKHVA
jgi:DNA helicase-2/ATP-dependent DNA helicase PcrA